MDLETRDIFNRVEIQSRYKHLPEDKKQIADFLLGYCFTDHEEVYTNGTVLVPMFRVLDALIQDGKSYCCAG